MEKGVIGEITEQVKLAQLNQRIVKPPAEPPHIYLVAEDGERGITFRKETATPPAERSVATDISTLVDWTKETKAGSEVWYSRNGVIGSPSPERPDAGRCSLALSPSPQLAYLIGVEKQPAKLTQTGIIRILRTTLYGTFGGDLLANVRKINLKKGKDVTIEQQRGKVSLERKDIAEMTGINDIPDVVAFDVPVFSSANVKARAVVKCDLDLDAETENFTLTVLPGEIEAAFAKGEDWLQREIAECVGKDKVTVYYGEPGHA